MTNNVATQMRYDTIRYEMLKPNSITLDASKQVRSCEPDRVMEFGFYSALKK